MSSPFPLCFSSGARGLFLEAISDPGFFGRELKLLPRKETSVRKLRIISYPLLENNSSTETPLCSQLILIYSFISCLASHSYVQQQNWAHKLKCNFKERDKWFPYMHIYHTMMGGGGAMKKNKVGKRDEM